MANVLHANYAFMDTASSGGTDNQALGGPNVVVTGVLVKTTSSGNSSVSLGDSTLSSNLFFIFQAKAIVTDFYDLSDSLPRISTNINPIVLNNAEVIVYFKRLNK